MNQKEKQQTANGPGSGTEERFLWIQGSRLNHRTPKTNPNGNWWRFYKIQRPNVAHFMENSRSNCGHQPWKRQRQQQKRPHQTGVSLKKNRHRE